MNETYNKETIDEKFRGVHDRFDVQDKALDRILTQTTLHNGRMKKMEKVLLIVGCITGTLLITNGSELIKFIMSII